MLIVLDLLVSHYIVPREKSAPAMRPFVKILCYNNSLLRMVTTYKVHMTSILRLCVATFRFFYLLMARLYEGNV